MSRKVEPSTLESKIERNHELIIKLKSALELHNKMINYRIERLESEIKNSQNLLNILVPTKKEVRF